MVRPDMEDLFYVGFSNSFVIRDRTGNIYLDTDPSEYESSKKRSLKTLSNSPILDLDSMIYDHRKELVDEFIVNINNQEIIRLF